MSRTIFIHNKSNHPQTFEVHGWNNNKNITVAPHDTARIPAPDRSSGAIIALHGGHEGEQAEITKDGFGGNDFIDLSNIVGAGGNLTVGQTDNYDTVKGDPNFMQDLNRVSAPYIAEYGLAKFLPGMAQGSSSHQEWFAELCPSGQGWKCRTNRRNQRLS